MDEQLHGGVGVTMLLHPLVSECFHKGDTDGQYTDGFGEATVSRKDKILGEGGPGHDLGAVLRIWGV